MFYKIIIWICLFNLFELIKFTLANDENINNGDSSAEDHLVIRIEVKTKKQLDFLIDLERNATSLKLDFWKSPSTLNIPVDLMIEQSAKKSILNLLKSNKIQFSPMIKSVGELLNEEKISMNEEILHYGQDDSIDFFNNFHTLGEINLFIQKLVKKYPDRVEIEIIGRTTEKRPMNLLKIGFNNKNSTKAKKIVWIDAGIHAREWIAPSSALFIANQLIKGADTDPQIRDLVNEFDFYILPIINVDGYVYSHTSNRLWRKTRSVYRDVFLGFICHGVDLNRNFNFHWLETGASYFSCSQAYAGPSPFSEPETRAISSKILELRDRIILYTALHSYSQLILFPWGYSSQKIPEDYADLEDIARKASIEIKRTHGKHYRYGSSSNVLYKSSGSADDWAKGVAKIKYSYTIELRDQGNRGFLLPAKEILPTGEEIFSAIKNMTMEIGREHGINI